MVRSSPTNRADSGIGASKARRPRKRAARGGRPSQAQALALRGRILEVATELFLTEGYGTTSIEAVAERAGISKRTFYHRFENKQALFAAVVHRIIEQIRPPPDVPLVQGATLSKILRRLAGLILRAALSPQAVALHRLVTAESLRFPNLARAVYDEGWAAAASTLLSDLLERELGGRRLSARQRQFAAEQFLLMVVTVPQRRIMGIGEPMSQRELDSWADNAVRLFLSGCHGLATATQP